MDGRAGGYPAGQDVCRTALPEPPLQRGVDRDDRAGPVGVCGDRGSPGGGPAASRSVLYSEFPPYPEWAQKKGIESKVKLKFWVEPDGTVGEIMVEKRGYSFIGREEKRKGVVVRFRFNDQHVRMAHLGDEVLDEKGNRIGIVTSCAIDTDGFLTGQAFIDQEYNKENQALFIYQQVKKQADLRSKNLKPGERSSSPDAVIVLSRFLK